MLSQFMVILAFTAAGELLAEVPYFPLSGNVTGMVLLFAALAAGLVKPEKVSGAADFLVSHMPLFFIPAGVGVMRHMGLLAESWLPILLACAASTAVVMAVAGKSAELASGLITKARTRKGG
ncbi:MAG: CidA/LrgA family protein [Oscillospiraceae bacterium]|nr:CidA/LrgA family protein [Oscillospiraceae bacterium]